MIPEAMVGEEVENEAAATFPHYDDESSFPTEVCTGAARTKEQSQRRVRSLVPRMVSKEQPTDLEGQTRAQLIMARRTSLRSKAEYICADSSPRPRFALAVARRTIHSRYLSALSECLGDYSSEDSN
jgi:hypothetical protein